MIAIGRAVLATALCLAAASPAGAAEPLEGRTVPIRDGMLHFESMGGGDGTPLVIINGGPGLDHRYVHSADEIWSQLSQDRKAIFYDQRGTGKSTSIIPADEFTVDLMVEDLEALRAGLGASRISLLGHSWGGVLAMAYATRHPERVLRMVLVGSGSPDMSKHEYLIDKVYPDIVSKHVPDDSPAGKVGCKVDALMDYEATAYYDSRNRPRQPPDEDSTASEEVCTAIMLDAIGIDLFPKLRTLKVPTLVINGRFDVYVAPTVAFAISEAIPGSTLSYFERSGHQPFEEEPDRFARVVGQFLDR